MNSISKYKFNNYKRNIIDLFAYCQLKGCIDNSDLIILFDYLNELEYLLYERK